jgi:hypothetical protein
MSHYITPKNRSCDSEYITPVGVESRSGSSPESMSHYILPKNRSRAMSDHMLPKNCSCDSEYTTSVGVLPGSDNSPTVKYLAQKVEEIESKQALLGKQTSDKSFTFTQYQSSDTWTITHNLNKFPSVQVQDSAGTNVMGEIYYNSPDQLTLRFSSAFSGKAYLN